ncbi:MAG: hypothetical protein RLZZ551_1427 [Actinomycetota bacterium]
MKTWRRVLSFTLVAGCAAGVVLLSESQKDVAPQEVNNAVANVQKAFPHVASTRTISTSWYCPGVPLGGDAYVGNDYGGTISISNPTDTEVQGVVTRFGIEAEPEVVSIVVPPRDSLTYNFSQGARGAYVSALVELAGGKGASVEQRAIYPAGESTQPCVNQPSPQWFFADGFTASDSKEDLLLTNPLPDATVINVRFVTKDGERQPSALQGYVLPPHSLRVLDIASQGARGEDLVGVELRAVSGTFVAARAQHYLGTGRLGYAVKLGAPEVATDWWLTTGDYRGKPNEQIIVFNPTQDEAKVVALFSGEGGAGVAPLNLTVPAHRVVSLAMSNIAGLIENRFAVSFSVLEGTGIVVEHVSTRQLEKSMATTVDLGVPFVMAAKQWAIPSPIAPGTTDAIALTNVTALQASARIEGVGPAGALPIAGLDAIVVEPGATRYVALPEGVVLGQLQVISTQDLVVMRSLPRTFGVKGRDLVAALPLR